jgi:hypothetical protein
MIAASKKKNPDSTPDEIPVNGAEFELSARAL